MIDKMGEVKDLGSKTVRDWTRVISSCRNNLRRLILRKQEDSTSTTSEIQESEETFASGAPRMREILSSLTDQWPDLLNAVDALKPHLEEIAEKLDRSLEVKSP
jgi:transposase